MKKFLLFLLVFSFVSAHSLDADLQKEIEKGKNLIEKFQKGEIKCQNLTNDDFHSIGEYVMDLMIVGDDHLKMNQMMREMHGEEGEELMHINMGKRFLGCDGNNSNFWMMPVMKGPMMGGMWGWWNWQGWNYLTPIVGIIGFLWLLVVISLPILVLILLILLILNLIKKLKKNE